MINPDNLIYRYKTEGGCPKDFRNYHNTIELIKNLRYTDLNPRKVLKIKLALNHI